MGEIRVVLCPVSLVIDTFTTAIIRVIRLSTLVFNVAYFCRVLPFVYTAERLAKLRGVVYDRFKIVIPYVKCGKLLFERSVFVIYNAVVIIEGKVKLCVSVRFFNDMKKLIFRKPVVIRKLGNTINIRRYLKDVRKCTKVMK